MIYIQYIQYWWNIYWRYSSNYRNEHDSWRYIISSHESIVQDGLLSSLGMRMTTMFCAATSSFSPSKMTPKPSKTIRTLVDSWLRIVTHPHDILMNGWFIEPNHFQLVYPFDEEIGLHNAGLCSRFAWADDQRLPTCPVSLFGDFDNHLGMKFGHGCNKNCTCSEIGTSLVIIITTPLSSE